MTIKAQTDTTVGYSIGVATRRGYPWAAWGPKGAEAGTAHSRAAAMDAAIIAQRRLQEDDNEA